MIIIELTYKVDLEQVEQHIEAHRAFLDQYYTNGIFIASGPKVPREGGIILALTDRATAEDIIQEDPFFIHGIADYQFIEFTASLYADALNTLLQRNG